MPPSPAPSGFLIPIYFLYVLGCDLSMKCTDLVRSSSALSLILNLIVIEIASEFRITEVAIKFQVYADSPGEL